MLKRSLTTARPYAEELKNKGFVLSATSASSLGELVNASVPVEFEIVTPKNVSDDDEHYEFMTALNTCGDGGGRWCSSFDHTVESISRALNNHVTYIRNVVVPRVLEFAKDAQQHVQDLGRGDATADLTITRVNLPELVTDPAFLDVLARFKGRSVVPPNKWTLELPFTMVPSDFSAIPLLSNTRLNTLVQDCFGGLTIPYLKAVWYSFFCSGDMSRDFKGPFISRDNLTSHNLAERLHTTLAYFLLANYYTTNPPDISSKESTAAVERRIFDHLQYAGSLLSETLERLHLNQQANIVVLNVDVQNKVITVLGSVYDRWLETGGKPEVMLGMLVGARRHFSVPDVDKNQALLLSDWMQYSRVHLDTIEYRKGEALRRYYLAHLSRYLTEEYSDVEEKAYRASQPQSVATLLKEVEEYLSRMKKDELVDVQKMARELVAGRKYGFTRAKVFIDRMDEIGTNVENADANEAALLAVVDYVVDYLLGQITIRKIA